MTFEELLRKTDSYPEQHTRIMALDPGETTGFAILDILPERVRLRYSQINTSDVAIAGLRIHKEFLEWQPHYIVVEDYKIYGWKTDQHTWAALHTPQFIGAIKCAHAIASVEHKLGPIHMEMAVEAKKFCTDDKLKTWGYYPVGKVHARDAIRHACFFALFKRKRYI